VSAHLLYQDFFRFLDAIAALGGAPELAALEGAPRLAGPGGADPWDLYRKHYLDPNRPILQAWWDQCLGFPEEVWAERVRRVRPEEYELLRALVADVDLVALANDTLAHCQEIVSLSPEPEVYFLVGFFSPDGFSFRVEGDWAIGLGLERSHNTRLMPVLIAHEYAHCYRRRLAEPKTLGERLVDEGFAVELAAQAFPERPESDHLLMRPGQAAALRGYEDQLWRALAPQLNSTDDDLAARVLYGRAPKDQWPSRAGLYLGWRLVHHFLETTGGGFDADAERIIRTAPPFSESGRSQ